MTPQEMRERTLALAVAIYRFTKPMVHARMSEHVALQLFLSATAVAANYRAACLGRSRPEFIAKLGVVREEIDEVLFWLEFSRRSGLAAGPELTALVGEASELAAIIAAGYRTAKSSSTEKASGKPA